MRAGSIAGIVRGLVVASHPLPCVAVTAFAAAYAASIGLAPGRVVLLAGAVLTGQLSIGWCNDAVDAGRDAAAARSDKPVATGAVGVATVAAAAALALAGCVALSLTLGLRAGAVHLTAVASGLAYDLGLKRGRASWLPYALSFALLPAVAAAARPHPGWPPGSVLAGAGLLGVAAHFANTVGDAAADAATGVRGLPQRIGPARSLTVTAVLVTLAAVVLVTGARSPSPVSVALLAAGAVLAASGAVASGVLLTATAGAPTRLAFRLTLASVGLVVVGFLLAS